MVYLYTKFFIKIVMPTARFNLKNKSDKDKETLIYLYFRFNEKRLKITTGETVMPRYWNFKERKVREVKSYPKHIYVNDRLRELKNAIESAYRNLQSRGIDPSVNELKKEYILELSDHIPQKTPQFWPEYELFIEAEKGRVVNDVIKDYNSLKKHLKAYEKHFNVEVTFTSFNYSFYQQFVQFLTYETIKPDKEKGLAANTVGKQIKNLKIFLNHCFRKEIVERFDISEYKIITEEVDKIYLSEEEITKIYNYDFKDQPELDHHRDLFVFGCYTGLRFSDLIRVHPNRIINGDIRIKQSKTNRLVVIPLHPVAKAIIDKRGESLTKNVNSATFNKNIKIIGRLAGIKDNIMVTKKKGPYKTETTYKKHELITSHTCRRSFCTNQFLKGVPSYLIMKISGHKTEKSFLKYIKIDEELAAKKIKEYW